MERNIIIQEQKPFPEAVYKVTVKEDGGETKHIVTLHEPYYQELTAEMISGEELIRTSFEFLLEREPKESILKKFELPRIQKFFQEYEETMSRG